MRKDVKARWRAAVGVKNKLMYLVRNRSKKKKLVIETVYNKGK